MVQKHKSAKIQGVKMNIVTIGKDNKKVDEGYEFRRGRYIHILLLENCSISARNNDEWVKEISCENWAH